MNGNENLENDEDLVPVKDEDDAMSRGYYIETGSATPTFQYDRHIVGKLSREELEDRYLNILDENLQLKKNSQLQEDKIKKLATKLIRVLSDKKRIEIVGNRVGGVTSPSSGRLRDPETEDLIEDQNQRIRELERENSNLRDKFNVARQQLCSSNPCISRHSPVSTRGKRSLSKSNNLVMYGLGSPSPVMMQQSPGVLNQQAHRLLEEARNENRMLDETICTLRERINIYEQEVHLIKDQSKVKETNYEEEISHLRSQISSGQRDKVNESVEIIKLQRENKQIGTQLQTYRAQNQAMEEQLFKLKISEESSRRDVKDLTVQLQEEQKKISFLNQESSNIISLKQSIKESDEKLSDFRKENSILREHNERLLNSAFDLERERQYQASENALKLQVSQLESAMKNDLNDKKMLSDALAKERESYAKLESDYKELQGKFYKLKQCNEENTDKLNYLNSHESPFDSKELEEALLFLRQKKASDRNSSTNYPSFMVELESVKEEHLKEIKKDMSELQVQYVDTINELEKSRGLLRMQNSINQEQRKEIESLTKRIAELKEDFWKQITEYKKLLETRGNRILKLESQLRENTYFAVRNQYRSNPSGEGCFLNSKETSVHTPSGQSLFEIHIHKVSLIPDAVIAMGEEIPRIFATWTFYDYDMQYSPVVDGPEATVDCSSYYKIKLKDEFLQYLKENFMTVEIYRAFEEEGHEDCKSIGTARVNLSQVLEYPSNKLHGSVMLYSSSGSRETCNILGTLDFWFKLHTAATDRIHKWLEHKKKLEKALEISAKNWNDSAINKIHSSNDETDNSTYNSSFSKKHSPRSFPSDPKPAPRVLNPRKKDPLTESLKDNESEKNPGEIVPSPSLRYKGDKYKKDNPPKPIPRKTAKKHQNDKPTENSDENKNKFEENLSGESDTGKAHRQKFQPLIMKHLTREKTNEDIICEDKTEDSNQEMSSDSSNLKSGTEDNCEEDTNEAGSSVSDALPFVVTEEPIRIVSSFQPKEENEHEENSLKTDDESSDEIEEKSSASSSEEDDEIQEEDTDEEEEEDISNANETPSRIVKQNTVSSETTAITELSKKSEIEPTSESVSKESKDDGQKKKKKGIFASLFGRKRTKNEDKETKNLSQKKISKEPTEESLEPDSEESGEEREIHNSRTETKATPEDNEDDMVVIHESNSSRKRSTFFDNPEQIIITVESLTLNETGNEVLESKDADSLYIEYEFLDLPRDELETPISLTKPKIAGEKLQFNFCKIIPMDEKENANRRREFKRLVKANSKIVFDVVHEPSAEEEECTTVGRAELSLQLDSLSSEIFEKECEVYDIENAEEMIGTLTITISAASFIRSLKI